MHRTSLGQATDNVADIPSVEEELLLLYHTLEVLGGKVQQLLELFDPAHGNLSRGMRHPSLFKEARGFLVVFPRYVEGAFKCGFMFESRFLFHDSILGPFPGRCQSTGRETSDLRLLSA
jgi:hypothetical protein